MTYRKAKTNITVVVHWTDLSFALAALRPSVWLNRRTSMASGCKLYRAKHFKSGITNVQCMNTFIMQLGRFSGDYVLLLFFFHRIRNSGLAKKIIFAGREASSTYYFVRPSSAHP